MPKRLTATPTHGKSQGEAQLRRIIIIGTALAVLASLGAGAAFAASSFNTYGANFSFSPNKAGSPSKPVALGFSQNLSAVGTSGNRAGPLTHLTSTMYGLRTNGKYFPTCSPAKIGNPSTGYDKACPKGSLVAQGAVRALLGPSNNGSASVQSPCNPYLKVYNSGQGKLTFFFNIVPPKYTCATLMTGASAPYPGTIKTVGKNLVLDVPLPPDVSTKAGNITGVYASLIGYTLNFSKLTKQVNGKTVGYIESSGCKSGTRPWSQKFTALNYNGTSGSSMISGTSKCS
jgi:hypothetical protein